MRNFSSLRRSFLLGGFALALVAALASGAYFVNSKQKRVLLAPMMSLEPCLTANLAAAPQAGHQTIPDLIATCTGPHGSGAALIESTLTGLAATGAKSSGFELGYTLNVPLLKLFKERDGDWVIDKELLGRFVRTLRDSERPAIVYLFSTHFGQGAPIEEALAAESGNLSWTPEGPLPKDSYYSTDIYNWTFASTRTAITARRVQAAQAVLREICRLEPRHIKKIRGITLLGEVHHLFPRFESGMGFAPPYLVSDYSETSKAGFREHLERYFGTIEKLNARLGTHWDTFDQIDPPSKDVRTTRLRDFTEHIDSFAHGSLPITGWAFVKGSAGSNPAVIRLYRNGELLGRVRANLGRQDVLKALPDLGTADTGWRLDMDFKALPPGKYRIDVFLERGPDELVHFASRDIAIVDRDHRTPQAQPQKPLPAHRAADPREMVYVDAPGDQSSYFYNPLVPYWHAFRALQVATYIQAFNQEVNRGPLTSCLSTTPRYTHQILPFTNPGWDETKFAVDASLRGLDGIGLGVSLYGEPTFGASFSSWLATMPRQRYGVTEFHPLKALGPAELRNILEMHTARGLEFLSFFMEPRWEGKLVGRSRNLFSLDPENPEHGSNRLYESLREVLGAPATAAP